MTFPKYALIGSPKVTVGMGAPIGGGDTRRVDGNEILFARLDFTVTHQVGATTACASIGFCYHAISLHQTVGFKPLPCCFVRAGLVFYK